MLMQSEAWGRQVVREGGLEYKQSLFRDKTGDSLISDWFTHFCDVLLLKRSVLYVCSTMKGCYYPSLEFGIKIASSILILNTVSHSYLESEKGGKFFSDT